MQDGARIQSSIEILQDHFQTQAPLDRSLHHYFARRRYIGSKDRNAIRGHVYQVIRHYLPLEWWLEESRLFTKGSPRLLSIAALVLADKLDMKQINELFSGDKYQPHSLIDEEQELVRTLEGQSMISEDQPLNVQVNCPDWIFEKTEDADLFRALNEEAPFDMRANILKGSFDAVHESLSSSVENITKIPGLESGLRAPRRLPIDQLKMFKDGWVEVQDAGSQKVCELMDVTPGQRVLDFCAGAGGKSLSLASRMENKGQIYLSDTSEKRLARAKVRLKRAGVHNYMIHALSSETDGWVKKHRNKFDVVVVDAPCTGTGTWRRNPEARFRYDEESLAEMTDLQARILNSAQRCVKPGGKLYYITCSVLADENQIQAKDFVKENEAFALTKDTQLLPHVDDTDGFYIAEFQKAAEKESERKDSK